MKVQKKLAWIGMLSMLCLYLLSPIPVYATESAVTISVTVPEDNYTVTLDIGEHGAVIHDGVTYTGAQSMTAEKGKELTYTFLADSGYELGTVTYNGKIVKVQNASYTAPSLLENSDLVVTFKKVESKPVPDTPDKPNIPDKPDTPTTGTTDTGDTSNTLLYIGLIVISGCVLFMSSKKRNHYSNRG